jgi:hypothetical protein
VRKDDRTWPQRARALCHHSRIRCPDFGASGRVGTKSEMRTKQNEDREQGTKLIFELRKVATGTKPFILLGK